MLPFDLCPPYTFCALLGFHCQLASSSARGNGRREDYRREKSKQASFPDPFLFGFWVHDCGCVLLPLWLWGPSSLVQLSLGSYTTNSPSCSCRPRLGIGFLLQLAFGSFSLSCGSFNLGRTSINIPFMKLFLVKSFVWDSASFWSPDCYRT